ncbi:alpha/beta fold hydrolase [Sporolactobacillus shoreicorticis]|uniref:Alpha/beta fold hydrolase n=1 Tax=Sporolactobacillus shoreicorticis TaxID=1923877 RepID=A0ABW5S3B5_9BACL|nr:alpha/beta hydrolase [Sporolactobacillus shoreicorticis]MCO7124229.1 alpha/beta fold hydrolase [Sporolactobacillus shoreicorticis]
MANLELKNYRLHYEYIINDFHSPTILFIHDLLLDSTQWRLLIKQLDHHFNYIVYDIYGHGETKDCGVPVSFDLFQSELSALIDYLHVDAVHLVGNGFGGFIAYEYAQRCSARVGSLTLLSVNFYLPNSECQRTFSLYSQLIEIDRNLLLQKLMMQCLHNKTPLKKKEFRSAFEKLSSDVFQNSLQLLIDTYGTKHFHFTDALSSVNVPTLLLHGDKDQLYPIQFTALFSACISNCRWFNIPNASHVLSIDRPDLVAYYLKDYLNSQKTPVPVMPVHQQIISNFRDVIQDIFNDQQIQHHVLTMNMMHDTEILWNGCPIEGKWNQRRAKEILLYLFLHNGIVKRKDLIQAFLSDIPKEQAKNNLRVWLSHLNKIFHNSSDSTLREILIVGEDIVMINAELVCDVRTYLKQLSNLFDDKVSLNKQAKKFIKLLQNYEPGAFSAFRCDWIFTLSDQIEEKLVFSMERLLPLLERKRMLQPMREILEAGKVIEPYDGYCDEKLALLQTLPQ